MEQEDFQQILKKYLQGEATTEEKRLIDKWYNSMEGNIYQYDISDESRLEARLWSAISVRLKNSRSKEKTRKIFHWCTTGVAASIVVALIGYYIADNYPKVDRHVLTSEHKPSFSWKRITNTKNVPELFVLPDQSKVTIEPGSKLRFSSEFDEVIREVYLEGEAFFEVSKNAKRPFLVYANDVTTKVLGTSFTVKAIQQEKQVTIAVRTGKVSVYTNNKNTRFNQNEEIILTPNQQVVVDQTRKKVSKKLVDNPQVIIPAEEVSRMRFEEAPVSEIFKALEKVYGVEIVFDEDLLSSCELTTIIADKDIFSRLNIICDAIGASYVLQNGTIIIKSAGCN